MFLFKFLERKYLNLKSILQFKIQLLINLKFNLFSIYYLLLFEQATYAGKPWDFSF